MPRPKNLWCENRGLPELCRWPRIPCMGLLLGAPYEGLRSSNCACLGKGGRLEEQLGLTAGIEESALVAFVVPISLPYCVCGSIEYK